MSEQKKKQRIYRTKEQYDASYRFLYVFVMNVFRVFHPVRAIGRENLPEGAALICANHTAYADPLMMVLAAGRRNPLRIMAKEELFKIPIVGPVLRWVGMFGVNRGKNDMGAIRRAIQVLKEGSKMMLFPQGTRVSEEDSVSAKTGAVMIAMRSGAPLVPVYIPAKKKWFRRSTVVIGEPYYPELAGKRASQQEYQTIADDLLARIYALKEQSE